MIYIGFDESEKDKIIYDYIKQFGIKKCFVFVPKEFKTEYDIEGLEYIAYTDIIMYRVFYKLLEVIDNDTLLVFNECMRTQNRSDLTYNCAHHYCAQTKHKLVFEYFPFIESFDDFMILLDFINKGRYKGKSFDFQHLSDVAVKIKPQKYSISTIDYHPNKHELEAYKQEKQKLLDSLGAKDPDTIPRQLHIWAGNVKKQFIDPFLKYVARNKRFKMHNIKTYADIKYGDREEYIVIDFPHRRIDFNDFLKKTRQKNIVFINSNFRVDLYYLTELERWLLMLEEFYDKASVYQ